MGRMADPEPKGQTQFHEGLICPMCGRSLVSVPNANEILFYCKTGHQISLADLLHNQTESLRHGLRTLLRDWEKDLETLYATASDARRNGYFDVAVIFLRQTQSLASRIELL